MPHRNTLKNLLSFSAYIFASIRYSHISSGSIKNSLFLQVVKEVYSVVSQRNKQRENTMADVVCYINMVMERMAQKRIKQNSGPNRPYNWLVENNPRVVFFRCCSLYYLSQQENNDCHTANRTYLPYTRPTFCKGINKRQKQWQPNCASLFRHVTLITTLITPSPYLWVLSVWY